MNGRIWRNVGLALAALAMVAGLAGCGGGKEEMPDVDADVRVVTAGELGATGILDSVYTGDGYLVLVNVNATGTLRQLITLDRDLNVTKKFDSQMSSYTFVTTSDGTGRLISDKEAEYIENITPDGAVSAYSDGERLYVCSNEGLFRNGEAIALPEERGYTYSVRGMMTVGGTLYAVLSRTQTRDGIETWKSTWLCPVEPGTAVLEAEGLSVPFRVDACASDGVTGWLLSEGDLYKTDGESVNVYGRLSTKAGTRTARLRVGDGDFLLYATDRLTLLTERELNGAPDTATKEKTVIHIAATSGYDDKAIADFNNSNEDYTAVIDTRYSRTDLAALNLAVANGEVDLVIGEYGTMHGYAKKGLLASLEEAAPGLFEDGMLFQNVTEAMKVDGKVYFLPDSVEIDTFMLPAKDAREFTGLEDFLDMVEKTYPDDYNEEFFHFLQVCGDNWIDLEKGEARFDDPSFRRVFKYFGDLPNDYDLDGSVPHPLYFFNPSVLGDGSGEGYAPVAVPNEKGRGVTVRSNHYFGVIKGGAEQGAAEFLRYMVLDKLDMKGDYPISRAMLEEYLNSATTFSGEPKYSEGQREAIREYMALADHVNQLDYAIYNDVIYTEFMTYDNGDATLDEALEHIQSRVSLYLAELG